jgi:hypothetical protein
LPVRSLARALAALTLLIGFGLATPAGAEPPPTTLSGTLERAATSTSAYYLPAGQPLTLATGTCRATFRYGQFGTIAFARVTLENNGCLTGTGVQVYGWGVQSHRCTFINANQYADCAIADGGATVQATVSSTLIGGAWKECWYAPSPGGCWADWLEHTPF